MRITRALAIIFLLSALSIPVAETNAQSPFFSRIRLAGPRDETRFQVAFQDYRGFIWLGSADGLFCFDGISVEKVPLGPDTLANEVTAITQKGTDTLWVGCRSGRIYQVVDREAILFSPEEGTSDVAISEILADRNGVVWWSTYGEGIYFFRNGRVYNFNHDDGLKDDYVYALEEDSTGQVWAASDGGLAVCRIKEGKKELAIPPVNDILPDIIVRSIRQDEEGNLWIGFQDAGIARITANGRQIMDFRGKWESGPVYDIAILGKIIWAATPNGIVQVPGLKSGRVRAWEGDRENISFGRVTRLLPDREGNIWVLSANGLYRSPGIRLTFIRSVGDQILGDVHSVMKDSGGRLWYSTDRGLFCMNTGGKLVHYLGGPEFANLKIMTLAEDSYGYLWAGTFDYGVLRLDPVSGNYRQITEKDRLINNNVLSISSHLDTLWMGTLGGASNIILEGPDLDSPILINSFDHRNGLVNDFIYTVFEDSRDRIWFGTDGDGISVYDYGNFRTYDEKDGLIDDVILSITEGPDGKIWFSTSSQGIYSFDGAIFKRYGPAEGLSSTNISAIMTTGNELLILHSDGLDIMYLPSGQIIHYGSETDLDNIRPDINTVSKDRDGNVWIGTEKGILKYSQGGHIENFGPRTVLEGMSVFLDPVTMVPGLSFARSQNHITFTYTGLWFSNPEKVRYRIMLEGFDLNWKDTYDRTATYSSLPPGKYTFKVKSSLDDSFGRASETSFSFRIKKPFWLSVWFILLGILAVSGSVMIFIRFRERRLKLIAERKKEKVEFEFQTLKNQVNPHFLFNSFSTLMSLIEDKPEEALDYTEKLSDFFRYILQFRDTGTISLEEEMKVIENYLYIQKKRYGDQLGLEVDLDSETLGTRIPPMTLQMLTENAVKHNVISKEYPLTIRIYNKGDFIVVENPLQPKKKAEGSTGIGLENIRKRYRLISAGEIRVEKTENHFRVWLPLLH